MFKENTLKAAGNEGIPSTFSTVHSLLNMLKKFSHQTWGGVLDFSGFFLEQS